MVQGRELWRAGYHIDLTATRNTTHTQAMATFVNFFALLLATFAELVLVHLLSPLLQGAAHPHVEPIRKTVLHLLNRLMNTL